MLDKNRCFIPERFRDKPLFNELHRGMNFGFMARRGYYNRPEVRKQPELMQKIGVNWVTLNANLCQDTFFSRHVYLDPIFSSGEAELGDMAKNLHDHGIRILLKPCLTPLDSSWMGGVNFPVSLEDGTPARFWQQWFDSFREGLKYYADFSERYQIEALIIGAEYFGTEKQNEEWSKTIETVRQHYSGPITYEFTRSSLERSLEWMNELDFLSMSFYPPAADHEFRKEAQFNLAPVVTLEEMITVLSVQLEFIQSVSRRFGHKPIAFTEIGTRSAHGNIIQPFNFMADSYYDGQEQANYMEAVFKTFSSLSCWLGLYWWKWDETQYRPQYNGDPRGDRGFTVQGKPAEAVLRKWFSALQSSDNMSES